MATIERAFDAPHGAGNPRAYLPTLTAPIEGLMSSDDIEIRDGNLDGRICPGDVDTVFVGDCACASTGIASIERLSEKRTAELLGDAPAALNQFMMRTTLRSDFAFWIGSRFAQDSMIGSILATPLADVERASVDERRRVFTILQHIQPVSRRAEGLWLDSTVTTVPGQVDFEHISTPTLIFATANDRFGTLPGATAAARRIPGARLIALPDGGHVWIGHQAEVWSAVVKFLSGIPDDAWAYEPLSTAVLTAPREYGPPLRPSP